MGNKYSDGYRLSDKICMIETFTEVVQLPNKDTIDKYLKSGRQLPRLQTLENCKNGEGDEFKFILSDTKQTKPECDPKQGDIVVFDWPYTFHTVEICYNDDCFVYVTGFKFFDSNKKLIAQIGSTQSFDKTQKVVIDGDEVVMGILGTPLSKDEAKWCNFQLIIRKGYAGKLGFQ